MDTLRFTSTALILIAGLAGCTRSSDTATTPVRQAAGAPPAAANVPAVPAAGPATTSVTQSPAAPDGATAPGVRVYLDPVTGEAREPTRAEAAASAVPGRVQPATAGGQAGSEGAPRERFVLPDGTEGVTLAPRDRRSVVVCRQADGSYSENCPPAAGGAGP